ncbi:MAG: prepilin peptidase [Elusimicrobiota bacterium]
MSSSGLPYLSAAIAGAILGSFVNVLVWRLPKGEFPWKPATSYCPNCRAPIRAMDNIPIISWLLLRGRCRLCRSSISWRYPLVEATLAGLGLITLWNLGSLPHFDWFGFAGLLWFQAILIAIAIIDFQTYLIPDLLSLGLALSMLIIAPWNPCLSSPTMTGRLASAVIGAAGAGFVFYVLAAVGEKIYKTEAMGGGDIKLAFGIGAGLGWRPLLAVVFLSSALGLVYAAPLLLGGKLKRRSPIPYGPFLVMAAIIVLWSGEHWPKYLKIINFPLEITP